jgi:hypothetical protein
MPQPVKPKAGEVRVLVGSGAYRRQPHALSKAAACPRLTCNRRKDERCSRRSDQKLLTEELRFDRRQEHAMLTFVFREFARHRQRPRSQIKQVICQVEPDVLANPELSGKKN